MSELSIIFMRTILMYFVVFLSMRFMGKREIGNLSVFDLVISIMIAEIAVFIIEDSEKSIIEGLLPLATLVSIQILIAILLLKNEKLRRLFDGKPSMLINQGKLDYKEMRKQRYNMDDLMLQLRTKDIFNVKDVEFAILETNGSLSVFPRPSAASNETQRETEKKEQPADPTFRYEGLPLSLILDGKVQDHHLQMIGKTRFWLKNALQEKGIRDFKEVFFCSIDHKKRIYVDRKD